MVVNSKLMFDLTLLKRRLIYFLKDKVSLHGQGFLSRNPSNSSYIYIFYLDLKFENLIDGLYVLYVINTHVKFHSNNILFTV